MKYDINNLTLDEKLSLLMGVGFWRTNSCNGKLKQIFMADGPLGLRMSDPEKSPNGTLMPGTVNLANTWDKEMAYLCGKTIADECVENDVDILLAPGVNIKRSSVNGRNFEYYSEDPYLAGTLACEFINGVQDKGVGTSIKHFCANNSEYDRFNVSSEVDDRTLHEIYLKAFNIALKAKPWTVMCSYNLVNGVYASENKPLLKGILRDEMGFDGVIISDWEATRNHPRAVKATLDLTMPQVQTIEDLKKAVETGYLTIDEIDFCVQNILNLIEKTENDKKKVEYTLEQRHANSVKIGKESIVLLKNEEQILPIKKGKVAVIGDVTRRVVSTGTGSANVNTLYKTRFLSDLLNEKKTEAEYFSCENCAIYEKTVYDAKNEVEAAYDADTVLMVVRNEVEGEAYNKTTIKLPLGVEESILNVSKYNKNVIVAVISGGAVDMSAWIDKVKGVIFLGFAGEGYNEALASIVSGEISPSGKLSETFPLCIEDTYCGLYRSNPYYDMYSEGVFVGYRYFDQYEKDVLFPFGYGLSYAKFEYSDLQLEKINETEYNVSYTITNTSDVDAKEISQVYVRDVFALVSRPPKELKNYSKDFIKAGESKKITLKLDRSAFEYYSNNSKDWFVENGKFEILVGSSSRDIRLVGKIDVNLPEETQVTQYHHRYDRMLLKRFDQ